MISWIAVDMLELRSDEPTTIVVLPFCKIDTQRDGIYMNVRVVLNDGNMILLDPEYVEQTLTIGVSYNTRLLHVIVHHDLPEENKLYAERFDNDVEIHNAIQLLGDQVDG